MRNLILLIALTLPITAWSTASQTHDLQSLKDHSYRVSGPDPYLIFYRDENNRTATAGVWLTITIDRGNTKRAGAHLYWSSQEPVFTHKNMVTAKLQAGENRLFLPLHLLGVNPSSLRVDIEHCRCDVSVSPPEWSTQVAGQEHYPSGFAEYQKLFDGFDLDVDDWIGQELNSPESGVFTFEGWDPRIINQTPLRLPTDIAAGVFFEFDYNSENRYQTYELFWQLKGMAWSALRSAHFLLENNGTLRKKIYLPFERIYSQRRLNHLRLDFEACETCKLELIKARIVGLGEQEKYQQHIPERIYYVHTEAPPAAVVKQQIWNKLQRDRGFLVIWLLLLLIIGAGGLWIICKRLNN